MTTLLKNEPMNKCLGPLSSIPIIADDIVFGGAMVGDNASGYGRPLVAGDPFRGHSVEKVDNTGGSAGALNIELLAGKYRLQVTITSVAITDVDNEVYASDDATYTQTRGANTLVGKITRYVTTDTAEVEFDTTVLAKNMTLLGANIALGAELVDSAGAFVDFVNPITVDGTTLRAGDVLRVKGQVNVPDVNSTDTLDVKLLMGAEAIFSTGDLSVTDEGGADDVIQFEVDITINVIGSSGKIAAFGNYDTLLNATYDRKTINLPEASEDISGSFVLKVQGDWSAEHAENVAYLKHFNVEHLRVQR